MICPKCGKKVSQEVIKCPNCQFQLSDAFNEFYKREKRIHDKIRKIRVKNDKKIYDKRIKLTDYLFRITLDSKFNEELVIHNISYEEWNCLQFKLISKIYLDEISKKTEVRNNLRILLETYEGEYNFKIEIISKNLTNLIRLAGVNPFSKYYLYQLNDFKLSIVEGLEVLGRVIEDLLYGEIRLEDLDFKIKAFMKETANEPERLAYENSLNNAIKEYFTLTGRDYFSEYFENELSKHEFTIDDAYNIKEIFLKKIIIDYSIKNLKVKLDNIIYSYFLESNSITNTDEDSLHLIGDTYAYYDSMAIGKGLKTKNKKKRSKKNREEFIRIQSEELGSDEYSYED